MPSVCWCVLQVQMLPKAALLLAGASGSERRDRGMRYLPLWAPGTGMLQAAETLHTSQVMHTLCPICYSYLLLLPLPTSSRLLCQHIWL
jgi:hypothetical protein